VQPTYSGDHCNSDKRNVKVLIGICSCHNFPEKRAAVRETWLTRVPKEMAALFFVGNGEGVFEKDVVTLPTQDNYESLPKKVQAFFQFSLTHYEFDYLFKCDDDTYLLCDRLPELFTDKSDFVGSADWWPSHADGGAGYLLSKRAVEIAAQAWCPESGREDLWVAELLRNAGIELTPSPNLKQKHRVFPANDNPIITVHGCRPEIMREIHRGMFEGGHTRVVESFYARHASWEGPFKLLQNGIFFGGGGNPNGEWEFRENKQLLIINWFCWPADVLSKTDSGYANTHLTLERIPSE
jgi:hypothetical protein